MRPKERTTRVQRRGLHWGLEDTKIDDEIRLKVSFEDDLMEFSEVTHCCIVDHGCSKEIAWIGDFQSI